MSCQTQDDNSEGRPKSLRRITYRAESPSGEPRRSANLDVIWHAKVMRQEASDSYDGALCSGGISQLYAFHAASVCVMKSI